MLQRNKAANTEGESKISKLKIEHAHLSAVMKMLESELKLWKEKNSDLRFKLNYAMQIKF